MKSCQSETLTNLTIFFGQFCRTLVGTREFIRYPPVQGVQVDFQTQLPHREGLPGTFQPISAYEYNTRNFLVMTIRSEICMSTNAPPQSVQIKQLYTFFYVNIN